MKLWKLNKSKLLIGCFHALLVVDCNDPGSPYGGFRDISSGTTFQSIVTYTCKPNHHLEGEGSQTCQGNGQWSGTKAVCLGMCSIFISVRSNYTLLEF